MRLLLILLFPLWASGQRIEAETPVASYSFETAVCSEGGRQWDYIQSGDWAEYNAPDGVYNLTLRYASPFSTGSVKTSGGVSIALPRTGGWQVWATSAPQEVTVTGGRIRLTATGGNWNLNWFELTPKMPAPPTADAGPDTVLQYPARSFRLEGKAAGEGVTLAWELVGTNIPASPGLVTLYDSTVLTYRLTVTDKYGRKATDEKTVTLKYDPYGVKAGFTIISDTGDKQKAYIMNNGEISWGVEW